jgi:hypothetical protein
MMASWPKDIASNTLACLAVINTQTFAYYISSNLTLIRLIGLHTIIPSFYKALAKLRAAVLAIQAYPLFKPLNVDAHCCKSKTLSLLLHSWVWSRKYPHNLKTVNNQCIRLGLVGKGQTPSLLRQLCARALFILLSMNLLNGYSQKRVCQLGYVGPIQN